MNTTEFSHLLKSLGACHEAYEWAEGKGWKEVYDTCPRGDWLLWLFKKTNPQDLKYLTLAKGHCANTVRHLMKDDRSKRAVDVAVAFGNGQATREELNAAAYAAYAAYDAAAYDAAAYAAYAAYAAADDAYDAAAATAADAAAAAGEKNRKATADICRQYLPLEIWTISK